MVFGGIKKFFNRIGGMTVDSTKKVGEGVSVPVDRFSKLSSKAGNITSKAGKVRSKTDNIGSGLISSSSKSTVKRTSPRVIEKMRMDKDEIEIFKELIDKKYDRGAKPTPEKTAKKEAFQKASLEELLKEDEKKGLDPKIDHGYGWNLICCSFHANDYSWIWNYYRRGIWINYPSHGRRNCIFTKFTKGFTFK